MWFYTDINWHEIKTFLNNKKKSHFEEQIKIKGEIIDLLKYKVLVQYFSEKGGEKSKDDCFRCSLFHVNIKVFIKNTNPEDRLCINKHWNLMHTFFTLKHKVIQEFENVGSNKRPALIN